MRGAWKEVVHRINELIFATLLDQHANFMRIITHILDTSTDFLEPVIQGCITVHCTMYSSML